MIQLRIVQPNVRISVFSSFFQFGIVGRFGVVLIGELFYCPSRPFTKRPVNLTEIKDVGLVIPIDKNVVILVVVSVFLETKMSGKQFQVLCFRVLGYLLNKIRCGFVICHEHSTCLGLLIS
jgi:hypothetical protein